MPKSNPDMHAEVTDMDGDTIKVGPAHAKRYPGLLGVTIVQGDECTAVVLDQPEADRIWRALGAFLGK